jgi:hypothetical protein
VALLELVGFYAFLRWIFGGAGDLPQPQPSPLQPAPSPKPIPPPGALDVTWPSTPPATLPPFPAGWEYDEPPPLEVQQRAVQLLPQLWAQGSGSRRVELIGGRWITLVAEVVRGGSKGVTAWRVKGQKPGTVAPTADAAARMPLRIVQTPPKTYAPATGPAPAPSVYAKAPAAATPATAPTIARTPQAAAAPLAVTTTQDVQSALNTLGVASPPLVVDGKAGPLTAAAVKRFQSMHPPLVVDGIAGPLTKAALGNALASSQA